MFRLKLTHLADKQLSLLENDPSQARVLKDVRKCLGFMETNLRHPSLNTHEFHGYKGPNQEKIFESYAQQKTSGAFRIFWYYGPGKGTITVIAIIPHP